jgi:hypothetical protein
MTGASKLTVGARQKWLNQKETREKNIEPVPVISYRHRIKKIMIAIRLAALEAKKTTEQKAMEANRLK